MYKFIGIVLLVLSSMSVLAGDPIKCKGKTKAGHDCKSTIVSKSTGYCNAHDPNKIKCKALNSKDKPCGVAPLKGQQYCRHHVKN
jgi:hypothetical protein